MVDGMLHPTTNQISMMAEAKGAQLMLERAADEALHMTTNLIDGVSSVEGKFNDFEFPVRWNRGLGLVYCPLCIHLNFMCCLKQ